MTKPPFYNQVTVIGMGLVGSSLMRVMAEKKLANRIVGCDNDAKTLVRAKTLALAHQLESDVAVACNNADLVVLATPVGAMAEVVATIAPALKKNAVITDTGSTKTSVIASVAPLIPGHAIFIPSHPIAGTEFSGPDAGFATLFKGRYWIITPIGEGKNDGGGGGDASLQQATDHLADFLAATGALVERMDADYHDKVLAITSHLPHLIAYTIVGTAFDFGKDLERDIIRFAASGFRDFTRIAASDPIMWRDVFINNADAVLAILDRFNGDLAKLATDKNKKKADALQDHFTRTRDIRRRIKDIGQL